jgi:hypothetical protein
LQQEQPICNKISLHQNPFQTTTHCNKIHFSKTHCKNNNNNPFAANSLQQIHLDTTHDTLSDNDAAGAPGVQFNLNDQVFQIFAFLLLAKEPVTLLRSSKK